MAADGDITGIIFDIKRFAIHDGPGIRTSVFLKGCPLRCAWCHNPEGLSPEPELVLQPGKCIAGCRFCVDACPRGAVSLGESGPSIDAARCVRCGACAEACPTGAIQRIGRTVTAAEVVAEIEPDRIFYVESGGGATFTGGEPLAQPDFLCALLALCRERGIDTVVDTAGCAPAGVLDRVAELAGEFLFDLKIIDAAGHQRFTGGSNRQILDNLERLVSRGAHVMVRVPLLPGVNDDPASLETIGRYLEELGGVTGVALLPFHRGGGRKYIKLGRRDAFAGAAPPPPERVAAARAALERHGLTVQIGG